MNSNTSNLLTVKEHKRSHSNVSSHREDINVQLINANNGKKLEKILLCDADPALIRNIYLPLMNYVQEIEDIVKAKTG